MIYSFFSVFWSFYSCICTKYEDKFNVLPLWTSTKTVELVSWKSCMQSVSCECRVTARKTNNSELLSLFYTLCLPISWYFFIYLKLVTFLNLYMKFTLKILMIIWWKHIIYCMYWCAVYPLEFNVIGYLD